MTERVDFYVLKSSTAKQRWTFACRLTEKAYLRDLKVVLLSETAVDARTLDEMLWTFNERSFVRMSFMANLRPSELRLLPRARRHLSPELRLLPRYGSRAISTSSIPPICW